jgi:hypothetical protein
MPINENTSHGAKVRAGRLLSQYIYKIALEETELIADPEKGDRMATKAEALARTIWKHALGYTEKVQEKIGGQLVERDVKFNPNPTYITLVYDRMEGKANAVTGDESGRPTVSDKVTKAGVDRINSMLSDSSLET